MNILVKMQADALQNIIASFVAIVIKLTQGIDMHTQDLDTKPAGQYAFAAARNARMRAAAQWSHYTEAERVRAERMKLGLELVYSCRAIYVNPRNRFITIKVEQARVRDRANLALLEKDYELQGIKKAQSDQGVIYRIPKL